MTAYSSALAQEAVERAKLASSPVADQHVYNSRNADKFIVRLSPVILDEVKRLALEHGRSINAELTAAVLEGLSGHSRTLALLSILKAHLGNQADEVLAGVPVIYVATRAKRKFVLRLPESVRDQVELTAGQGTMNSWIAAQVLTWVNTHRQSDALLNASMLNRIAE